MNMLIDPCGCIATIYAEQINLAALGKPAIRRASHVEPDDCGRWWVDLAPVGGPQLGPFDVRSSAIAAETTWLGERLADLPID